MAYDEKFAKELEKLKEYLELEGDELTSLCEHLIDAHSYPDYMGEPLLKQVKKFLRDTLKWYEESTVINVRTETKTITQTYKELEHL